MKKRFAGKISAIEITVLLALALCFACAGTGAAEPADVRAVSASFPVVSIRTEEGIGPEYTAAHAVIQGIVEGDNPVTAGGPALVKESRSGEVISLRMTREDGSGHRKIELPGLGRSDEWKCNRVQDGDVFRMMLAYRIWDICCESAPLELPAVFAELVVDDEDRGLCILRPKTADALKAKLRKPETVYDTGDLETEDVPKNLYQVYPVDNLSDLGLYYEATCACGSLYDDTKIISTRDGKQYAVPGRPEYVFGTFPGRYNYLAWKWEERLITGADFGLEGGAAERFDTELRDRWQKARGSSLSDEAVAGLLNGMMAELCPEQDRTDGEPARLEAQKEQLQDAVLRRFRAVDRALSDARPEEEGAVPGDTDSFRGFLDIRFSWNTESSDTAVKLFCDRENAYVFLPSCAGTEQVTVHFDEGKYGVYLGGAEVKSGEMLQTLQTDESCSLRIRILSGNAENGYSLKVMRSGNLPAMFINTFNGTLEYLGYDKTRYEPGIYICADRDGSLSSGVFSKLRVRGSSSLGMPQQSYTLVTAEKAGLFGLGKAEKWCLVGSGFDVTRLRNPLAYSLAKSLEMNYAVDYRLLDVFYNGEYHGLTLLAEPVEVADYRMDPEDVQCLLKVDREGDKESVYQLSNGMQVMYPPDVAPEAATALEELVNRAFRGMENCRSAEEYRDLGACADLESFARRYIISAAANEVDSNALSMYYYLSGDKLFAGPCWDFDRAFGNEVSWRAGDIRYNTYPNGPAEILMLQSAEFRELIRSTTDRYRGELESLGDVFRRMAEEYRQSLEMTCIRFPDTIEGFADFGTPDASLDYAEKTIRDRMELILDTIDHPERYHHVLADGRILWIRDGDTLTEELIGDIRKATGWTEVRYAGGEAVQYGDPVTRDMELTGP